MSMFGRMGADLNPGLKVDPRLLTGSAPPDVDNVSQSSGAAAWRLLNNGRGQFLCPPNCGRQRKTGSFMRFAAFSKIVQVF